MKRCLLLVLLISLLVLCDPGSAFVHIREVRIVEAVFNRDYSPVLMNLIDRAKESIRIGQMCFYVDQKTGKRILDRLIQARKRGVEITVFLEGDEGAIAKRNQSTKIELERYGIKVFFDSKNKVVHAKFVVVDDRLILAGSTNMTDTSMNSNNESNILVSSTALGTALSEYHRRLIADPSADVNIRTEPDRGVQLLTDRCFSGAAMELIQSAEKELIVSTYLFEYRPGFDRSPLSKMFAELVRAHQRGVKIRIFLEQSSLDFNQHIFQKNLSTIAYLKSKGISGVRLDDPRKISHMKFIVADRQKALLGSVNWYWRGIEKNHQVNWLVSEKNTVAEIVEYFEGLFSRGSGT